MAYNPAAAQRHAHHKKARNDCPYCVCMCHTGDPADRNACPVHGHASSNRVLCPCEDALLNREECPDPDCEHYARLHAIPKRAATTVGVDEMLAQSDPEATQIADATRNREAEWAGVSQPNDEWLPRRFRVSWKGGEVQEVANARSVADAAMVLFEMGVLKIEVIGDA